MVAGERRWPAASIRTGSMKPPLVGVPDNPAIRPDPVPRGPKPRAGRPVRRAPSSFACKGGRSPSKANARIRRATPARLYDLGDRPVRQDPAGANDQSFPRGGDRDVLRRSRASALPRRHAEGAAKIRIDTLEPIESTLGRRQLRFVLAWAELHQAELLENWRLARDGETLNLIDPLQ